MQAMKKYELALKYWDGQVPQNPKVVTNRLMRWINQNKPLLRELRKTRYQAKNREFTPHQVEIIYKFLGEP